MKKLFFLISTIMLLSTPAAARTRTIWMIGDGAMATYSADTTEARGWGQMMNPYFAPNVKCENDAQLGMSIKTFDDNDGIKKLEKQPARTIMFIQLGTNDLKEYNPAQHSALDAYTHRIQEIIAIARKNRVNVVLCTPLAQPYYKDSVLIDRLGGYPDALRHIAAYEYVALLDLEKLSREWLQSMTEEEAANYYVTLNQNELINNEYQLNEEGAKVVADMVRNAIQKAGSDKLKKILR